MKAVAIKDLAFLLWRLEKIGCIQTPTYHLKNGEIKNLANASNRKLVAWAVSMKLDPPPQPLIIFDNALEIARAQQMVSDLVSDILRPSIKP